MGTLKRDENCLGYIVLYGNKSEIDPEVELINDKLEQHDLADYWLSEPTAVVAVTRAAKELERTREDKFFRPLVNNESKKTVAIVRQHIDREADEIDLRQETTGCYDKRAQEFSAEGFDAEDFKRLFKWYSTRVTGDDVRRMSRSIVDSTNVISLRGGEFVRDAGGVYFVPPGDIERINSLKNVLESLEIGYVKALRLINGPAERDDVFRAALFYFRKQVEEILESVERINERVSSLERYRKRVVEIRSKLNAYASLTGKLGVSGIGDLESMLDECETKIQEKISKIA